METSMSALWIATLVTSLICFLLKLLGYSLPESILNRPVIQRINALIPIALLSALVAVQTFGNGKSLTIDHRLAGVLVAAIALRLGANFPIMMGLAALTSALIYNF
jgi:branched-subunit amino acid transport protein